jgi:heme-degrading monooxygenase HmoA
MLIEITMFRLVDGADEAAFLEADKRVQDEFIPNIPGFARRTTARGGDGEWLVVVLWSSAQEADAAAELSQEDPETRAFQGFVDAATVRTNRYTTLD